MDTTKFTMGIVGLVVIILMVTGAVIPVVEDAQQTQVSTENNTTDRYIMSTDSNVTLTFTLSDDGHLVINDSQDQAFYSNSMYLISEDATIRVQQTSTTYVFRMCVAGSTATTDGKSLVYENDTLKLYNGVGELVKEQADQDYFLYPDSNGKYLQVRPESYSGVYMNNDATIYGIKSGINVGLFKGTLSDMELLTSAPTASGGSVYSSGSISISSVESEDGLTYQFASASQITFSGEDLTDATGPAVMFVPVEYNYISDDDSMMRSLLGIIPLLMIIVAVLYAVRLMGASRN